jgi:hypothetical protein
MSNLSILIGNKVREHYSNTPYFVPVILVITPLKIHPIVCICGRNTPPKIFIFQRIGGDRVTSDCNPDTFDTSPKPNIHLRCQELVVHYN